MPTVNVNVGVETEIRNFPLTEEAGLFLFELLDETGFVVSQTENPTAEAIFPLVPEGVTWTVRCTRNGVSAEAVFTVPRTVNEIAVPVTVTVSFT